MGEIGFTARLGWITIVVVSNAGRDGAQTALAVSGRMRQHAGRARIERRAAGRGIAERHAAVVAILFVGTALTVVEVVQSDDKLATRPKRKHKSRPEQHQFGECACPHVQNAPRTPNSTPCLVACAVAQRLLARAAEGPAASDDRDAWK
jgi:hypothetical protein